MQKYKDLRKKVKEIEFQLGIGYVKTDDKLYKILKMLNLLCVIWLTAINAITLISFYIHDKYTNVKYIDKSTYYLIILATVLEIGGLILNKLGFHITGNALNILPLFYLTYIYMQTCQHPDGFLGFMKEFYFRYAISYILIFVFSAVMLFIAIRQQIRTRRFYKRTVNKLYNKYLEQKGGDTLNSDDEEWDEFIKNFDPRKDKI